MLRHLPSKLTAESFVIISRLVVSPTAELGPGACLRSSSSRITGRLRLHVQTSGSHTQGLTGQRLGTHTIWLTFSRRAALQAWCIRVHCRSSSMAATLLEAAKTCVAMQLLPEAIDHMKTVGHAA